MIILIGGEKGGTGKTTTALNLAVLRAKQGKSVLLVDTDKQGSANFWAETRLENEAEPKIQCIQKTGRGLRQTLLDLSEHYQDIIVDAGGHDSVELRAAMAAADKAFIPVQASQFDLWTLTRMNDIADQVQAINPDLVVKVLINRAPTNPSIREAKEAQGFIADFDNLGLCSCVLRERIAYRKAVIDGLVVSELVKKDIKAISEITAFYDEVFS